MGFEDLADFFVDELRLPIKGKTYVIPGPNAKVGLDCHRRVTIAYTVAEDPTSVTAEQLAAINLTDEEEQQFLSDVLGAAYAEMQADGVSWAMIQHAAATVSVWVAFNLEAAEEFWASPKAPDPTTPETPPSPSPPISRSSSTTPRKRAASAGANSSKPGP